MAAAAVLAAVFVGVSDLRARDAMNRDVADMQRQIAAQQLATKQLVAAVAGGRTWDMSWGDKKNWWHCTVVQPKHDKAMLVAQVPKAPAGMAYQAWVIHRGKVHSAGVLPSGGVTMVHMPMPVQRGDVIAFSIEPEGGSSLPTGRFFMQHQLD